MSRFFYAACFALLGLIGTVPAHATNRSLLTALRQLAPQANPKVLGLALEATQCAISHGEPASPRLAVIDYSLPSTTRRLWVFDLAQRKLLFRLLVAHGRNSGENQATQFSNKDGSLESSLGLFRTLDTYEGHNGYSLRMAGLEPGTNDHALKRALVIHGARYVNADFAKRQGRIGRSWGCPAVRTAVARPLIDTLKGGQYVFSYYPNARWLHSSPFLACHPAPATVARAP